MLTRLGPELLAAPARETYLAVPERQECPTPYREVSR
jgi:hypothetical protein